VREAEAIGFDACAVRASPVRDAQDQHTEPVVVPADLLVCVCVCVCVCVW